MDGRGGCCIARYTGGGGYDMDKIDHIMLRFRPIAPKPSSKGSDSGGSPTPESSDTYVKTGSGKRRYARKNNNNNSKRNNSSKRRKSSSSEGNDKAVSGGSGSGSSCEDNIVTLPLLPESPDRKDTSPARGSPGKLENVKRPVWWSFKNEEVQSQQDGGGGGLDTAAAAVVPEPVRVVGTWVRVECITSAWVGLYGLGCTDHEKLINLEQDTCPGFVSDGLNGVQWTNRAYREMAAQGGGVGGEVVMWLVVKDGVKLPPMSCSGFTCSVRLVTCGKEKNSLTLPCDVWRMDCGGFAWRLDMNAALSLGR